MRKKSLAIILLAGVLVYCQRLTPDTRYKNITEEATLVGAQACRSCHPSQYEDFMPLNCELKGLIKVCLHC